MFKNLQAYYDEMGGELDKETTFGEASWDEVADPRKEQPLTVVFNHGTCGIRAQLGDGRVVHVGTVVGDGEAEPEDLLLWFQEYDGTWPKHSLQAILERLDETNARFAFEAFRRSLPRAGPDAVCVDCGRQAHRVYWGTAFCENCLLDRRGGP